MINKIIIVGDMDSETLTRWREWAVIAGYEVEHKTFADICNMHEGENPLIILDEYGLNDAPLPELQMQKEVMIVDHIDTRPRTTHTGHRIHAALAAMLAMHISNREVQQETVIRQLSKASEPIINDGRSRRSKGDRKGRKADRWR